MGALSTGIVRARSRSRYLHMIAQRKKILGSKGKGKGRKKV